mmetsp:Transcript_96916/g.278382  ORF Transcript_96916/g.278382 Transcript_96916/m.278382 type:complete len:699 (+) Transcript_96916:62-2158(+)
MLSAKRIQWHGPPCDFGDWERKEEQEPRSAPLPLSLDERDAHERLSPELVAQEAEVHINIATPDQQLAAYLPKGGEQEDGSDTESVTSFAISSSSSEEWDSSNLDSASSSCLLSPCSFRQSHTTLPTSPSTCHGACGGNECMGANKDACCSRAAACAMCERCSVGVEELRAELQAAREEQARALARSEEQIRRLRDQLAALGQGLAAPNSGGASDGESAAPSIAWLAWPPFEHEAEPKTPDAWCVGSAEDIDHEPELHLHAAAACGGAIASPTQLSSPSSTATSYRSVPSEARLAAAGPEVGPPSVEEGCARPSASARCLACLAGHRLQVAPAQALDGIRWICDGCERKGESISHVRRHGCRACNFDLCEDCYTWRLELVAARACPSGHVLMAAAGEDSKSAWICDKCSIDHSGCSEHGRYRCPLCDYDLCESCYAAPSCSQHGSSNPPSSPPSIARSNPLAPCPKPLPLSAQRPADVKPMARAPGTAAWQPSQQPAPAAVHTRDSHETFLHLHNNVAMPLMHGPETLERALHWFTEANAMHVRLYAAQSPEALYHMACCLSMGATVWSAPHGGIVARAADGTVLSPHVSNMFAACAESAEIHLDHAATMMEAAVRAGYNDVANLFSDPDIATLRHRRSSRFLATAQNASAAVVKSTLRSQANVVPAILAASSTPMMAQNRVACTVAPLLSFPLEASH